ncbi:hypothetical protein N9B94_01255 [Verrucomicrobia bacterium]|nr:hypothetical protein [Verrucomicrobiota bacterium]
MTLPAFSFRFKLLVSIMLVMVGLIGSTMILVQEQMRRTFQDLFEEKFEGEVRYFVGKQDARLSSIKERAMRLSRSVRLIAVMEEGDEDAMYRVAWDELNDVVNDGDNINSSRDSQNVGRKRMTRNNRFLATYFRVLDEYGVEVASSIPR